MAEKEGFVDKIIDFFRELFGSNKEYENARIVRSFEAKLRQSDKQLKEYYSILENEVLSYKNAKTKMSVKHEIIKANTTVVAKMQIRGKTLAILFALDPKEFEGTTYKVESVDDTAENEVVPTLYKINNDRRCNLAKDLIARVMTQHGLVKKENPNVDYVKKYAYKSTKELYKLDLLKVYKK